MSSGALERNTFEAIEAYVLHRMDPHERRAFEQRMSGDPGLRADVELQRENIRAIELGGFARMLKEVGSGQEADQGPRTGEGAWRPYLKYAAVLVLILSGALWLMRPSSNERLFAEHFVVDPGLPVEMGVAGDPAFADAMVSYKEAQYAKARSKWMPLLQQDPRNDTLLYYVGSAALAEGDADAAITHFVQLVDDHGSVFRDRSRWYLLLAYVRMGRSAEAKALGLESDRVYGERARVILSELN
jgi:tetratricopeptide (TPR) repeat protein